MERESDLKSFAEVVGKHRKLHAWPPEELAPGVRLVRRAHTIRDPKTQEVKETAHYLEPVIEDSRLYYWHLSQRNQRQEDARNCRVCNGAAVIRRAELVPGQPGFGMPVQCPRWRSDSRRCEDERRDGMGL